MRRNTLRVLSRPARHGMNENSRRDETHCVCAVEHASCPHSPAARARKRPIGSYGPIGLGARMRTGRVPKAWRMKRSCLICGERLQKRGAFRRGASAPGLLENAACLNAGNRKCFYKICRKFAADNQTPSGTYGESCILTFATREWIAKQKLAAER